MKKCGIYKITNPFGQIYIGQSKNIEKRFSQYKNLQCKYQKKLYNSLLEYGIENHTFEIIEECLIEQLDSNEQKYIKEFNSYKNGLNMTKGGEISPMSHPEIVNKIIGRKHSEKTKNKIRESLKKKWISGEIQYIRHIPENFKHSLKTIEKMKQKRALFKPSSKKVYCIITNKVWSSIKECWEEIYFNKVSLSHFRNMIKGVKFNKTTIRYYA